MLQERGPLPGPETGLFGKELSKETRADKAREFTGKGHPSGEQQGKGNQENSSVTWLVVSGFMVMGLVSRWSLATNHSNSVFPGGARIAQPRWILERGILGSGPTRSVFF